MARSDTGGPSWASAASSARRSASRLVPLGCRPAGPMARVLGVGEAAAGEGGGACHRLRRWGTREARGRLQQLPQVGDDPVLPWPRVLAQLLVGLQDGAARSAEPGATAGTVAGPASAREGRRSLLARATATPQAPLVAYTGSD